MTASRTVAPVHGTLRIARKTVTFLADAVDVPLDIYDI